MSSWTLDSIHNAIISHLVGKHDANPMLTC
jgi:hypothetical protein